jgi:hypothetical protein
MNKKGLKQREDVSNQLDTIFYSIDDMLRQLAQASKLHWILFPYDD